VKQGLTALALQVKETDSHKSTGANRKAETLHQSF
jgi:hypothetical protein